MRQDELARLKDSLDPPWDDVREQRVLNRVMAARREPASASARKSTRWATLPSRIKWGLAASGLALAAALLLFVYARPESSTTAESGRATAGSRMALADGSTATLEPTAALVVEEQSHDRVRIQQQRGSVRYEVKPDPRREFDVRAGSTTVRVRGTIFTVRMSDERVEVAVERGLVEVTEGTRHREVAAGESLQMQHQPTQAAPSETAASYDRPPEPAIVPDAAITGPGPKSATASAAELQARADAARESHNLAEAATALETLAAAYPHDPRVPSALFTLGRVERSRGRDAAAARAFQRCYRTAPTGPLAEEALAEAVASWSAAGAHDATRDGAHKYLEQFPNGAHAERMRSLSTP